jgi:3-dehydroquinate dehydratase-1
MKLAVSIRDAGLAGQASVSGADLIELRLDLVMGDLAEEVARARAGSPLPLILTLRSDEEGGKFSGEVSEWSRIFLPLLRAGDIADLEMRHRIMARAVKGRGCTIIGSYHTGGMPGADRLRALEQELRRFSDIPKIVVSPCTPDDLLSLISFQVRASGPLITGVMGEKFRFMRGVLPLFGSEIVYCHCGTPVADGQYHISEMQELRRLLGNGIAGITD